VQISTVVLRPEEFGKESGALKVASSGCDGRKHEPSTSLQTILIHIVTEVIIASAAAVTVSSLPDCCQFYRVIVCHSYNRRFWSSSSH
jgi:hypothetical protein